MSTLQFSEDRDYQSPKAFLSVQLSQTKETLEISEFFQIGRAENSQLIIDNKYTSSRHARIERKQDNYFIRDLRSRNGTYVNGSRILEAQLKNGDQIQIGEQTLMFSFSEKEDESLENLSKNEFWNQQLHHLPQYAQSPFSVLITGPSGSGKEVIAHKLHKLSERYYGPFVSVNCGALSESLIESELFGHIKGSFTGASDDRKGAFETARGGTLFLDEIGELPLSLQPKLLRALENSEIRPVGSDKNIKTDVRVIAATHATLQQRVVNKEFREDLYFRLNVLNLQIPALRRRMEDFESLFYHFAKMYRVRFSFLAIEELKKHNWPGNIRELKNAVARASAIFGKNEVKPENISLLIDKLPEKPSPVRIENGKMTVGSLKQLEKELICNQLKKYGGNQRKVADELEMPKSTLHDRIKNYKINIEDLLNE